MSDTDYRKLLINKITNNFIKFENSVNNKIDKGNKK